MKATSRLDIIAYLPPPPCRVGMASAQWAALGPKSLGRWLQGICPFPLEGRALPHEIEQQNTRVPSLEAMILSLGFREEKCCSCGMSVPSSIEYL